MEYACIKMKELRELFWSEIEPVMRDKGYRGSKSAGSFKRETGKNTIEFYWWFYTYWPNHQDFHFMFRPVITEILAVLPSVYAAVGSNEIVKPWNAYIFEGDFIESLKSSEMKWRHAYQHHVNTEEEALAAFRESAERLVEKALPLADTLSTLTGFQQYYLNNPQEIVRNLGDLVLFESCLVAAYLKSPDCYADVASYLQGALDAEQNTWHYKALHRMEAYIAKKASH